MARRVIEMMDDMHLSSQSTFLDYYYAMQANNVSYANTILLNNPSVANQIMNADNINIILNETYRRELIPKIDIDYFLAGLHAVYEKMIFYTQVRGQWSPDIEYNVHNFVYYQGKGYYAYTNSAPPKGTLPTDTNYWIEYDIRGFQGYGGIDLNLKFNWDNTQNYKKGDVVIFQNKMWYALADNTNYEPNLNHYPWVVISMPKLAAKTPIQRAVPSGYDIGDFWFQITQGDEVIQTTWGVRQPEPTPRFASAAFSIDTNIYIVGGIKGNFDYSAANEMFDTVTGTWSVKANRPGNIARAAGFSIGTNGYCVGGMLDDGTIRVSNVCYDSITNTWSNKAPLPISMITASIAVNDKAYIIGGENSHGIPISNCYIYDSINNSWSSTTPKPTITHGHTVATDGTTIYAIGGLNANKDTLGITEAYDVTSKTWSQKDTLNVPRSYLSSFVQGGMIFAVGGLNSNWYSLDINEKYDIANNEWITDMPMNYPRSSLNALVSGTRGYAIGGIDLATSSVRGYNEQYNIREIPSDFEMIINTAVTNNIITENDDEIITESGENIIREDAVTNSGGKTVSIPMVQGGTYDYWIDWGDGQTSTKITTYNDPQATHTYAVDGEYTIKLMGTLSQLQFTGNIATCLKEVTKCILNLSSLNSMFKGCINLTSIADGIFDQSINVTDANSVFSGCTSLSIIPLGLFDNNINITTFESAFRNCGIITIPTGLFDSNNLVVSFHATFIDCNKLVSIPMGLFKNNTLVKRLYGVFARCTSLESIPNNLFINNPVVETYEYLFLSCGKVTELPNNLFGNACATATNFHSTLAFMGITNIPAGIFQYASNANNFNNVFDGDNITAIPDNCFNGNNASNTSALDRTKIVSVGDNALKGLAISDGYFQNNTLLTTIGNDIFGDTLTNLRLAFNGCSALTTMGNLDLSQVVNLAGANAFGACTSITNVYGFKDKATHTLPTINQDFVFNSSAVLTHDSLMNISDSLVTMTPTTVKTLSLHSTALSKLTMNEKLNIINKYWNLTGFNPSTITAQNAVDFVQYVKGNSSTKAVRTHTESQLYYYVMLTDINNINNVLSMYAVDKSTGILYEPNEIPIHEYVIHAGANTEEGEEFFVPKGADGDPNGTILKAKIAELTQDPLNKWIDIGNQYSAVVAPYMCGLEELVNASTLFEGQTRLVGTRILGTFKPNIMNGMFYGCSSMKSITFTGLDTSNCTSMATVFDLCSALTTINGMSGLDTSKVTTMVAMFDECSNMANFSFVETWNNTNVTNMNNMFSGCKKLTAMPNIKMPKVTNANSMYSSSGLTSVTGNRLPATLQNAGYMFSNCKSLNALPSDYTSIFGTNNNLTTVQGLFEMCSLLSNVGEKAYDKIDQGQYIEYRFNTTKAKNQILAKCPNVTNASYMFSQTNIDDIPIAVFYNNPNLTDVSYAFSGCTGLYMSAGGETVGSFETYNNLLKNNSKLTTIAGLFQGCTSLEWFGIETTEGTDAYSSLVNLIDASYLYADSGMGDMLFGYGFPVHSPKLQNISYALKGCPIYYLDTSWAGSTAASVFPALQKCEGLFYNCTHLGEFDYGTQTNAMPFINSVTGLSSFISGKSGFYNCTNVKDYSSIPAVWKQA